MDNIYSKKSYCFIDLEVNEDNKVCDYGAVNEKGVTYHSELYNGFNDLIKNADFVCGHNIINFDSKYIDIPQNAKLIDTLYLSPLLFPNKPYHKLLKDDKLLIDELNNPLSDAIKSKELFFDEINAFEEQNDALKKIYYLLLKDKNGFSGFFLFNNFHTEENVYDLIINRFKGMICDNAPLRDIIFNAPVELAFSLSLISASEKESLIPNWVLINYPKVDSVMHLLRGTPCNKCEYCKKAFNATLYLEKYFGFHSFRTYNGETLQESAVNAAINSKSLLAIFPTGGGKSLTFQVPAFMNGELERGLTVVISPLQSLMKDQVDNLAKKGIAEAVTINGLLSPIERADAIERVKNGIASILYISPESLRSVTIEHLLLTRHIARFVIDEAHCFSAWGHDFRVDYLYIGDFIKELQDKKGNNCKIPISCFTATAKQKVIIDIKEYFKKKLNIELELFATDVTRSNLKYAVLHVESDVEKYNQLRLLLEQKKCPTIVFVSRTKRTIDIAKRLINDGFKACAFNGKMGSDEKRKNQEAFINDEVQVIVATSAFGMGVDKDNVGLVIHYDISDSLENYIQESGRAGRNQLLNADCYVLFNDEDLNKHFVLLNQTKLSINEINNVWKAIKFFSHGRTIINCSALEIARQAGWDYNVFDIETKVRTALNALETAGYIKRGKNTPRIYATSIIVKNMVEASKLIDKSKRFSSDSEKQVANRIIKSLISSKYTYKSKDSDAESRVDYISDMLGIKKSETIDSIQKMREEGILSDTKDLSAYIQKSESNNKSLSIFKNYQNLEEFLLKYINIKDTFEFNYKELNEAAIEGGIKYSTVNAIKTIYYYWKIKEYIKSEQDANSNRIAIKVMISIESMIEKCKRRLSIAEFIVNYLYRLSENSSNKDDCILVHFSLIEILNQYSNTSTQKIDTSDIEEALLFLSKVGALKLEGGFLVLYSGMRITRLENDNKIRYKKEDYSLLNEYYKLKMQQIHIIGEYANIMVNDYNAALKFVSDYFLLDYKIFISKYFVGRKAHEIEYNATHAKYEKIFGGLTKRQREIIDDKSKYIVVAAGPGSGKTLVLVRKLASLVYFEDVKYEQLLMLTFSRAAAIGFKEKLKLLIGNAVNFIEIKTFHSYCYDILGKIGRENNSEEFDGIVKETINILKNKEVDLSLITKTVLVVDEAQDIDSYEFEIIKYLMEYNDDMRIILVGDDDQNIYEFRGADSKHMNYFVTEHKAKRYSLVENFRSCKSIVKFSDNFVKSISNRMKNESIKSMKDNEGMVRIIRHGSENLEKAIALNVINDYKAKRDETIGVLTNTNLESLIICGILIKNNVPVKLVQSNDGFDLYNLMEIRFFIEQINMNIQSPIISDKEWVKCCLELNNFYSDSSCLPIVENILKTFANANKTKYKTDFEMFLHESHLEDFYTNEKGVVTISTIHKSKGREYDKVYMLLQNITDINSDEVKRKIYVGITRAKNYLSIHYNNNILDKYSGCVSQALNDSKIYERSDELVLQLTFKDVYLDFFKDKNRFISTLKSGMHLLIEKDKLGLNIENRFYPILCFSKNMKECIIDYEERGYFICDAIVRFVCIWKGKNDNFETLVILPDLYLKKS